MLVPTNLVCFTTNVTISTEFCQGGKNVRGIKLRHAYGEEPSVTYINERAFEGMSKLQFLSIVPDRDTLYLPRGLNYLPPTLRNLQWRYFPTTCLPAVLNLELLFTLSMPQSKLEKLWDGIKVSHFDLLLVFEQFFA